MKPSKATYLLVITSIPMLLAGCFSGERKPADFVAEKRVTKAFNGLNSVKVLATEGNSEVRGLMLTSQADGACKSSLAVSGIGRGEVHQVRETGRHVFVERDGSWHISAKSDPLLLPARIPVNDSCSLSEIVKATKRIVVFGGVQVNGQTAMRYDGRVDLKKLPKDSKLLAAYKDVARDFPIQFYMNNDGRIIRMQFPENIKATKMEATDEGGPLNAAAIDFSGFNSPVSVKVPTESSQ